MDISSKLTTKKFSNRIIEIKSEYTSSVNEFMLFGMIYFGVDTSPRSLIIFNKLYKNIEREIKMN